MERFPLHRSLVFWLGLPGLLFLLWAWADSAFHLTIWSRGFRVKGPAWVWVGAEDSIRHGYGLVGVRYHREAMATPDYSVKYLKPTFVRQGFGDPFLNWEPEWREEVAMTRPGFVMRCRIVAIPHWLILTAYLAGWYGLLVWRRRAKGYAWQPPPEAEPQERSGNPDDW